MVKATLVSKSALFVKVDGLARSLKVERLASRTFDVCESTFVSRPLACAIVEEPAVLSVLERHCTYVL